MVGLAMPQETGVGPLGGDVTLVEGSSFAVSDPAGDMAATQSHGVFVRDTRIVSRWQLTLDGGSLEPLAVVTAEPFDCTFVTRAAPRRGAHEPTLVVTRRRLVSAGLREDVTISNHGRETAGCRLVLAVEADFADLFDVKEGRAVTPDGLRQVLGEGRLDYGVRVGGRELGVQVRSAGAVVLPGALVHQVVVGPREEWRGTIEVLPSEDGAEAPAAFPLDLPVAEAAPARRTRARLAATPGVSATHEPLGQALRQSARDLTALRVSDPARPDVEAVAAGAPWFMALFGRDSLLTSLLALPFAPDLALGTLTTLAAHQGRRVEPMSEEEPGRILHEVRRGDARRAPGGSAVYYGTVDATPLFVVLLDELARWGAPREEVAALLPAADRALEWVRSCGDLDGDGFVEYRRKTDRGLLNQGWKDSEDGIVFAAGQQAEPPLALVEVQAYVYGAYAARAHLASVLGDEPAREHWAAEAAAFRRRFDEAFWLPERGYYALALDGDKRAVDALTSNIAHPLWTGVALPERAGPVAERLLSPELFSGWGVRTLSSAMAAYNPVSYHCGSVWPHDNAVAVAGLARYGQTAAAQRVASGLLELARAFGGRLPELVSGFGRDELPVPVPYPSACSPQAWAAATPVSLARTLLGLRPCVPHGRLSAAAALPRDWGRLRLSGVPLGTGALDVDSTAEEPFTVRPAGLVELLPRRDDVPDVPGAC